MTHRPRIARGELARRIAVAAALASAATAVPRDAAAQTDYYNTDAGRPVVIEDAYAIERRGFEIQAAPLRLERSRSGVYTWGLEPELAFGFLPRTQFEVGVPLAFVDAGAGGRTSGLAGVELSVLHNLNVETAIPALGIVADVLVPAGGLGPDKAYPSLKGIATKTFSWARFHVNGQYTLGSDAEEGDEVGEASRWMAGVAVDRTFPLRSLLVTADVFAEQPLVEDEELSWTAEAGFRYQTSPQFNIDFGVGRRFAGSEQGWFFTFGAAHAFAVRSLLPIR